MVGHFFQVSEPCLRIRRQFNLILMPLIQTEPINFPYTHKETPSLTFFSSIESFSDRILADSFRDVFKEEPMQSNDPAQSIP